MKNILLSNIIKSAKKFSGNTSGAVALIVGVTLVVVLIAILSLTIDLGKTQNSYSKGQGATDAAASATAEYILKSITQQIGKSNDPYNFVPDDYQQYAETVLKQNFQRDQSGAVYDPSSLKVTYDKTTIDPATGKTQHSVTVTACANIQTPFAQAADHDKGSTRTCTTSIASFALVDLNNLEVAFALDFTDSMYAHGDTNCYTKIPNPGCPAYANTKAKSLNDAMNYVLDTYYSDDSNSTIFGSIIPFTGFVNLYPYSETMVTKQTSLPSAATVVDNGYMTPLQNVKGEDYSSASVVSNYNTFYQPNMAYVFNRIPALTADKLSSLISSSNSSALLPFPSWRTVYDGYTSASTTDAPQYSRSQCYNGVIAAALDQRIEKILNGGEGYTLTVDPTLASANETAPQTKLPINAGFKTAPAGYDYAGVPCPSVDTGCSNTNSGGNGHYYFCPVADVNCTNDNFGSSCMFDAKGDGQFHCSLTEINGGRKYEYHESFPVQPLTNKKSVLKQIVERYVNNSNMLYGASSSVPASQIMDLQSSRLNKSLAFSNYAKTMGTQGLIWSWFTISNSWQNLWNAESINENYYDEITSGGLGAASKASRSGLPSANHVKHLIMITDGVDNDGAGTGAKNICDAYAPVPHLTDDQYVSLCSKIKAEGIKIHVILYDFNQPTPNRYSQCASPNEYYDNVNPTPGAANSLKNIMDNIFKTIMTDLIPVQITK